jgi:hypothetical protein
VTGGQATTFGSVMKNGVGTLNPLQDFGCPRGDPHRIVFRVKRDDRDSYEPAE